MSRVVMIPCPCSAENNIYVDPVTINLLSNTKSVSGFFGTVLSVLHDCITSRSGNEDQEWYEKYKKAVGGIFERCRIDICTQPGRQLSKLIAWLSYGDPVFRSVMEWSLSNSQVTHQYLKSTFFTKNVENSKDIAMFRRIRDILENFGTRPYLRLVDVSIAIFVLRVYCNASNFELGKPKDLVQLCRAIAGQIADTENMLAAVMDSNILLGHMPVCFGKYVDCFRF